MQRASPGFRAHVLEIQARRVEYHVTLNRVESSWEIRGARESVFDVNAAGDARAVQRPFEGRVDLRRTLCVHIWYIPADQP